MKNLLCILTATLLLLCGLCAHAQVELQLSPVRHDFMVGENVVFKLTITNYTDKAIQLSNTPGRPWLNFMINRQGENMPLTPTARAKFPDLALTPGSRRSFEVDLAGFYAIRSTGRHAAVATIRMPDGHTTYSSNRALFAMIDGGKIREFHIQARGQNLRLNLKLARIDGKDCLFGQVEGLDTHRIHGACYLARFLNFMKPIVLLDSAYNMHVLCQSSPELFTYAVMDTKGNRSHAQYYKRTGGPLDLISTGKGIIPVGVAPYERPKPGAEKPVRKTSDRPF